MLIEITYNVTDVYMSTTETPVYVEISFEQPGGSAAVWGSITGTLSNQTDLQNALNLKVPYTGATGNVNLGEYELKAGQVTLDTSPTGTAAVGTIRWNDTTGTSETTLKGGNVIIKNGVDLVARVVNKVTPNTTLTKAAYQAVRVSGAQGQRLAIELAQANNDAGSADTIGLVTETIATNQEGFIMTVGQLEGINTTGSLQGETWVDGDVLYLSPTTAGAITNVKPTAVTGHIVVIGYVEYAHVNNGKIYVKVMNGWELDELHNVSIVTPANNQGLFYNATSTLWENKSITTALGYTPVPTTRNITINGVTYDLSADRTYTISTGISGSGAAGQVTYWTGASAVSGSNNLYFDPTNIRLGVGTNAPQATFAVRFPVTGNKHIEFSNIGGVNYLESLDRTSGNAPLHLYAAQVNSYIAFTTGTVGGEKMRLHGTGNLVLGGTVSTDNGQRLQVTGDVNFGGASGFTWDNTNSRLGIGTNAPAFNLSIKSSTSVSTIHNQNNSIGGQYFITAGPDSSYMTAGASFNGTNWVAQHNTAVLFGTFAGDVRIYANKSLTSGNIFTPSERFTIFGSTGNVAVNSTTDLSVRFGVVGDTLIRGSGNTSATSALAVQNSDSNNLMAFVNSGSFLFGQNAQRGYISITDSITTLGLQTVTIQNSLTISNTRATSAALVNGSLFITRDGIETSTVSSTTNLLIVGHRPSEGFAPTSGTALFTAQRIAPTINQTGGANGITRGLYVNPTLTSAADFRAIETTAGNVLFGSNFFWDNANGRLGIGTATPAYKLDVSTDSRINGDLYLALNGVLRFGTSLGVSKSTALMFIYSGTSSGVAGGTIINYWNGSTYAAGLQLTNNANTILQAGGTFTDNGQRLQVYGDTLLRGSGATSATTALTVQNSSSTNLFTVRNDGVMAQGGGADAGVNFFMQKSLSGSVYPTGIYMVSTITSTSTNGATMFISDATTQAASFTLPKIEHFKARQTTFGAGSTVTNQYGFFAEGTLTGATNNYGFFGNIASGTGRWNLYMAGTADNYLAGDLGIGTTSVTNWLNIAASTTAKAHINLASGVAPTSPANGDIWFDGTDIKMRIGGVTKTFTLV